MAEHVIYFQEYTYRDISGISHYLMYVPKTNTWTVSGLKFELHEIEKMFQIPEDELIMLILKYGK